MARFLWILWLIADQGTKMPKNSKPAKRLKHCVIAGFYMALPRGFEPPTHGLGNTTILLENSRI